MKVYQVKKSEHFPDGLATIYTIKEALERDIFFLPYDRWRDAQVGEYAETVDEYITPIIKRNDSHLSTRHIKTPTGCFHLDPGRNSCFDTEEFYDRNTFSRRSRWNGDGKLTEEQEQVIDIFIANEFQHLERALRAVYGNGRYSWKSYVPEVACSEKFKRGVMGKVSDIIKAQNLDISIEKILQKLETALDEIGTDSKNFKSILQMSARAIGEDFLEEKHKIQPFRKRALFADAEEAEYDETEEEMKLVKGPIRDESQTA